MDMEEQQRTRVLDIARSWLKTPFHDCACVKGAGVDCAMLVAAVFEEAGLIEKVPIEHYSPQWFLHRDEEKYLSYIVPRAVEIKQQNLKPADLVIFKIGRCFAHGAIITEDGWPYIIHAYKPDRMVTVGYADQGDLAKREKRFFRYAGWAV